MTTSATADLMASIHGGIRMDGSFHSVIPAPFISESVGGLTEISTCRFFAHLSRAIAMRTTGNNAGITVAA
jgi:hypothetical protein